MQIESKNLEFVSKLKCPFCGKGLVNSNIVLAQNDGILIHPNFLNEKCKNIFPIIDNIILLSDYKFWTKRQFSIFLNRNEKKLPKVYLDYFSEILRKIEKKDYFFPNIEDKNQDSFIKFQQIFHDHEYRALNFENRNSPAGYIPEIIKNCRINNFVDDYRKIKHCKKHQFYSGDWIMTVCSADGKDIIKLNNYLKSKKIYLNNVLTDISFFSLLEAKKKFHHLSAYFVLSNSQDPPFFDNSFDICYVHDGLHHLPNPPAALVNLGKKASRLLFVAEAQKNIILILLRLQKAEAGNVEYRFTRKEIMKLLSPYFKEIKIHTSFIQNVDKLQKIFYKIDSLIIFILFKIAFIFVNLIIGKTGNSMLISAIK